MSLTNNINHLLKSDQYILIYQLFVKCLLNILLLVYEQNSLQKKMFCHHLTKCCNPYNDGGVVSFKNTMMAVLFLSKIQSWQCCFSQKYNHGSVVSFKNTIMAVLFLSKLQ